MDLTIQNVKEAARAEAAKMQSVVKSHTPDQRVSMSVAQFSTLAGLIDTMCDLLTGPDARFFGEARYWVPLDSFVRLRNSANALDRQCEELRRSLEEVQIARSNLERVRLPGTSPS